MSTIRTRFAPSPTGIMHIGNIRTALLNYLFAKKHNGTFVLRVEDTDPKRNFDPGAQRIQKHLSWLGLNYDEGPEKPGNVGPYFQSKRNSLHQKVLQTLIEKNLVYRCFATPEELEAKRARQIAMKQPPRYDRAYANLSQEQIDAYLAEGKPFVWRLRVDSTKSITFSDITRGTMEFHLKNFSDFPLTRHDGSFTFMFANTIDDILMNITHVIRGEDHLTNTVGQVVLYQALEKPLPTFWHTPILCNTQGKKLSKRDQGFSLEDLIEQGFLPQAIVNYLGIIGGSFSQEIMNLQELVEAYDFSHISSASQVKYDLEKLRWVNHKWLTKLPITKLVDVCLPKLQKAYGEVKHSEATKILQAIHTDIFTLNDCIPLTKFYFNHTPVAKNEIEIKLGSENTQRILTALQSAAQQATSPQEFLELVKKQHPTEIKKRDYFGTMRFLLTGAWKGLNTSDLIQLFSIQEIKVRITNLV